MKHRTILIADDDPGNIRTFNELLLGSPVEYEIVNANTGNMAAKIARATQPDVIITDWEMPEMSGIELIRVLKADPETADIPVIMASGVMLTSADLDIALAAGAVDYIRKPIDETELRARLRSALEMRDYVKQIREKSAIIEKQENALLQQHITQLRQELQYRQEELASKISFLTRLEQEHRVHTDSLKKLKPYLNKEGRLILDELLSVMTDNAKEKSWMELHVRFDEIHIRFYERLDHAAEGITKTEKTLCAYLLLNMTNTEIAELTGKNSNSINVSFSRIRSKLGVAGQTELRHLLAELNNQGAIQPDLAS